MILSKPKKSTVLWAAWIASGVALDAYLLRKSRFEETLTGNGRRYTGIHPARSTVQKRIGQAFWIGFCVWIANHFAFGPHSNGRLHRFVVDAFSKSLELTDDAEA